MSSYLELSEALANDSTKGKNTEKYGILVDTDRSAIVVLRFFNHHDLLDVILSDTYSHLILYRTQYQIPTDEELEEFYERLCTE